MLSFLHRWDYCWKCEFDKDVKIEYSFHHEGEQLRFYKKVPWRRTITFLYKGTSQNTDQKVGCSCNL